MRRILLAIVVLAVIFALSCGEDQPIYPQWWLSASSPFNALSDLIFCFDNYETEPNVIKLVDSIISEDFTFYFDPNDVGEQMGDYAIPEYWGKDEFMQAVNNMFNQAYKINFIIPILDQGEDAFGKPAGGDTTFVKNLVTINLILMVDATMGYQAQGFCDFEFHKGSTGLWQVFAWRDHTGSSICTQATSLGHILAMYYQP